MCLTTEVIAIVESDSATLLQFQHLCHMPCNSIQRAVLIFSRVAVAKCVSLGHTQSFRKISDQRIMRRCLVGKCIRCYVTVYEPLQQVYHVAAYTYRGMFTLRLCIERPVNAFIYIIRPLIKVTGLYSLLNAPFFHLGSQAHTLIHADGQWLCAAHATKSGSHIQRTFQRSVIMYIGQRQVRFVSALHYTLRAYVYPAACSHLPIHHQPLGLQFPEVFPCSPLTYQVGVGNKYTRRILMRPQYPYRLAALHHQRFVLLQIPQASQYLIKTLPVARGLAYAAIYHQVLRALSHIRVQVVLYHAISSLCYPVLAGKH